MPGAFRPKHSGLFHYQSGLHTVADWIGNALDRESQTRLIQVMNTYIISEAKPKLGALVKQAAAGKTIYLLNGKAMVALVPARPTHDVDSGLDVAGINARLASSENGPTAPWEPGQAARIARRTLQRRVGS